MSIYLAYFRRSLSPHRLFFYALQYFMKMVLDTLWLRMLARGNAQQKAIDTLATLAQGNQFRENALLLLSFLRSNLEVSS